jgi:hypothetical protein
MRLATVVALLLAAFNGLLAQGTASAAPGTASRARPLVVRMRPSKASGVNEHWDTGQCPDFLPMSIGFAPPGDVSDTWVPLQDEAISQVEQMYGQNGSTDMNNLYANSYARDLTRAFMFVDLVKAVDDVVAGTATSTEKSEVTSFEQVVQYGREWVSLDADNIFVAQADSESAVSSSIANDVIEVLFAFSGLPWTGSAGLPSLTETMNAAQGALWGTPATTTDSVGDIIQNYPLGGAETQQALQQTLDAVMYLSAIGQSDLKSGPQGTNSALDSVMGQIENGLGAAGGVGDLAEAVNQIADVGDTLVDGEAGSSASLIETLVNIVWQASDGVATETQIVQAEQTAQALPSASSLQGDLASTATFEELFQDFVAMTLHTSSNVGATGNDPDCRQLDKLHTTPTPLGPGGGDPTMTVTHYTTSDSADYSYTTQTVGGYRNDPGNTSGELSDPAVVDWSLSRDTGPGSPRIGANWPISEITYGQPGPVGDGYLLNSPSTVYPVGGSFTISFNGANGQNHTTAPLTVSSDSNGTVHPTDSEVEQAIINADPTDFPGEPCSGPDASDTDAAVPPGDQGQGPCTDWNPSTHLGTELLVSGDQPDNNKGPMDYQVIFDIMVRGDLGGWDPVFTASTNTCGSGGICLLAGIFPLLGNNITSRVLWPYQQNDVCLNDPMTCSENDTFGWGDEKGLPAPYTIGKECQAVSPVAGMLQIEYAGQQGGAPDCDQQGSTPVTGSWVMTPSFRYRSYFGSYWNAWRVPPSINSSYNFLNIENASFEPGQAGIDPTCSPEVDATANATCLAGQGTHWLSEFAPGDQIVLYDPSNSSGNGTGGLLSLVRTVQTVVDDTHMILTTSAECSSGSDGNDCDFYNTAGYTSFMNPDNGQQGQGLGMVTIPCGDGCTGGTPKFQFDIRKLTGLNAATNCTTWAPSPSQPNPPTSGCYYSNTVQFQAQDGNGNGWWNASLPTPPSAAATARYRASHPAIARASGDGPWIHAPIISTEPKPVLAGSGSTATFTVKVTGTPTPAIQWQVSANAGKTWANIAGAKASTYSVAVSSADSGHDYRAVVKNANGTRTSSWGTIGVAAAPVITKNPASITSLHRGQTFKFSSAASGDPAPTPTWQISLDGGKTWQLLEAGSPNVSFELPSTPVTGAAGRASAAPAAVAAPSKDLVRVVYQNAYGTATSKTATLTITDTHPDVGVAASVSPDPVAAGAPASALITVGDYSGVKATNVSAVSTFSTSLGFKSLKQISGPTAKCAAKAVTGGESDTCTWATFPANSEAQFKATLLPKAKHNSGTISVAATLTQSDGIPSAVHLSVPINKPWADLQLTGKGPKTARAGARFADVVTVRNAGPDVATKAKATIAVPASLALVKAAGPGAKCTSRKGMVTCTIARLLAGRAIKITLTLKGAKKGTSLVAASVSAATPDYARANNSLSITTVIK